MQTKIQNLLKTIEAKHAVEVMFAVESGSRAWGLSSDDSDHDVRFVYRRPVAYYLSVFPQPSSDTITVKHGELDAHGWDLKKALGLMGKSNPGFYQWVKSPIRYIDHPLLHDIGSLSPRVFSTRTLAYHYGNLAKDHYRRYISGMQVVEAKKLLYFASAVASIEWIGSFKELPPLMTTELFTIIDDKQAAWQARAVRGIKVAGENTSIKPDDVSALVNWLVACYKAWEDNPAGYGEPLESQGVIDIVNQLFLKYIGEAK